MADQIIDNILPPVFRNEEFSIELPIDELGNENAFVPVEFEQLIESITLKSVGTQDIGITLLVENNRAFISGKYQSTHNDNILFVSKGEATRLQIFEYDNSQPDGFAKDLNGENIPLDTPLPLSDEKFAEEKIKFPTLVQPIRVTSIEQLPMGQDLVLAQQDPRENITVQYELTITHKDTEIEDDGGIAFNSQGSVITKIYEQVVKTDVSIFNSILQTYYTTGVPAEVAPQIQAVNIVLPESDDIVDRVFELRSSTLSINEGESFTISLSTNISFAASFGTNTGIQNLVSIPYTITGISADDIESVNNSTTDTHLFSLTL